MKVSAVSGPGRVGVGRSKGILEIQEEGDAVWVWADGDYPVTDSTVSWTLYL